MICRKIENGNVVWFGSIGKNPDGTAIKRDNFSKQQEGVSDSLTQRLSLIKGELWYNITYGLPLFDKIKSKVLIDSQVINIITSHPDVIRINNFSSTLERNNYSCYIKVITQYGNIDINYKS